jgi:hypothetical protein
LVQQLNINQLYFHIKRNIHFFFKFLNLQSFFFKNSLDDNVNMFTSSETAVREASGKHLNATAGNLSASGAKYISIRTAY